MCETHFLEALRQTLEKSYSRQIRAFYILKRFLSNPIVAQIEQRLSIIMTVIKDR